MGDRSFETLVEGGSFFEGPRWHDGRWWVSDFFRHSVYAVAPDGTTEEVLTVEAQPSGLGWLPDGPTPACRRRPPPGPAASG
jgi:sugar lactone lactonase YvrE